MDMKIVGVIAVIVVIVAVIAGYLLLGQPGSRAQTGIPTPTTTARTTRTTTTTTRYIGGGQQTNTTTETTTAMEKPPKLNVDVDLKAVQPSQRESEEGVVLKIEVSIKVTTETGSVDVEYMYFDNIKPGSNNPLVEDLYLHYDPPRKTPITEDFTVYLTNDLPQNIINQWQPGTNHTLTIIYYYKGARYTETIQVMVHK